MRPALPVLLTALLVASSGACSSTGTEGSRSRGAAPGVGRTVDIGGGRRMYVECSGTGSPTVVLEAGLRNRGDVWSETADPSHPGPTVFSSVAGFTRVCEYDRPGTTLGLELSRSDPVPQPRAASAAVADLHALLDAIDERGPFVLVGHSTGGLISRLYASTYPGSVVGLVQVDALNEWLQGTFTPEDYAVFLKLNTYPPEPLRTYSALETIDFTNSFAEERSALGAHPLPAMPVVVLSRGKPTEGLPGGLPAGFGARFESVWQQTQDRLAALLVASHRKAAESGHYIQLERPQLVIDAVRDVVEAVRASRKRP
jgi:pimeloyl-ACP methyl ester carboxylesterase